MREKIAYQIDEDTCKKMIHGVCRYCGGELVPMETVDISGNPTFWGGCKNCMVFCWGISPKVYEMARIMVDEQKYQHYSHLDYDDPKLCRRTQISGAVTMMHQILSLPSGLIAGEHEITVGEVLEGYDKAIQLLTEFMSQVGYTPEDEHYWLHHGAQNKIANIKEFLDALTFNGHRITKPIIPQSR